MVRYDQDGTCDLLGDGLKGSGPEPVAGLGGGHEHQDREGGPRPVHGVEGGDPLQVPAQGHLPDSRGDQSAQPLYPLSYGRTGTNFSCTHKRNVKWSL
jgi:hypothetical protein